MKSISIKDFEFCELELANKVIDQEIKGLIAAKQSLDGNFRDVINLLLSARGRVIATGVGKSGVIAKKFVATLASTGTPSMFIHPVEALHGDLGMITPDDILILLSNSGESSELDQIIEYCKRFNIHSIGICRNQNSSMVRACSKSIVLPNIPEASRLPAPTTSTTMMLALCDAIAVVLAERKGFSKADFGVFHPGGNIGAKLSKLRDFMHAGEDMPLINHNATVNEAIGEITKKRFGCVGVLDEAGNLIGVLTDGDLRRNIDKDYRIVKVHEIMTQNPVLVSPEIYAAEMLYILNSKKITNCFAIEDNKPVGIIHIHDLLKAKVA
ncbi:MAG: KpsF/GutQ family sugar-phosphate isomerase [Candidatus Jidaibacter sp.]|jgi:arabinose-5-phosphate isomerase|nr:KpsF/GutQ family sugar-phosphate isomerase [Candidatus Jidaibacter sp.]